MMILDTNVLSALMQKPPDPQIVAWLDEQPAGSTSQRLNHTRGGGRIHRRQKIVQPRQIGQALAGPFQLHQRGTGSGLGVLKLSAQACTA